MIPKLYIDLDGVLADFDGFYFQQFGVPSVLQRSRAGEKVDHVDWTEVAKIDNYFLQLPPMVDAFQLWEYCKPFEPTILTGVPNSVPQSAQNKRDWVAKYFGAETSVITCKSKEKSLYCQHKSILVDDWNRYQHLWVAAGGIWITHVSAAETIKQLEQYYGVQKGN